MYTMCYNVRLKDKKRPYSQEKRITETAEDNGRGSLQRCFFKEQRKNII